VNRNDITGTYLTMLVYRHLLTMTVTWQNSCIITNYNQKISKIYLFKYLILLFDADDIIKYTQNSFCACNRQGRVPKLCSCVQATFLYDVIRNCDNLLTPFSRVSHLLIRDWKRRKLTKDERKDHGTVDEPSLESQFHKIDAITFLVGKI